MEYTMLLLLSFWKVRRILYLEKGSVFYHGIFISVIWQDDLEGMCPNSHWKYNADKNVNADTSQLNGNWLDNLISLWSPLLCKLSKSEWYWQIREALALNISSWLIYLKTHRVVEIVISLDTIFFSMKENMTRKIDFVPV